MADLMRLLHHAASLQPPVFSSLSQGLFGLREVPTCNQDGPRLVSDDSGSFLNHG